MKATWIPCDGDAHSNAYIDHCMSCLRHQWGKIAVCMCVTECANPQEPTVLKLSKTGLTGTCRVCHSRLKVERTEP